LFSSFLVFQKIAVFDQTFQLVASKVLKESRDAGHENSNVRPWDFVNCQLTLPTYQRICKSGVSNICWAI